MRFFLRASRFMCECWLEYYLMSVRRHIYMEFTEIDILLDACFSSYNKEVVAPTWFLSMSTFEWIMEREKEREIIIFLKILCLWTKKFFELELSS